MSLTDTEQVALVRWVETELRERVVSPELIADGLNLVVAVSTSGGEYILRRPNELRETPMFIDTVTEYRALERLDATEVPAPRGVALCRDESILGAPFLLITRLDGDVVPLGSRLPERYRHSAARKRFAHEVIDTLATLHTTPPAPFEEVCGTHTIADQVASDITRVERAADAVPESFSELAAVGDWLRDRIPESKDTVLTHGDYRPGNVLFTEATDPEESDTTHPRPLPTVSGVLDWETPSLGDPRTELGYLLLRWRDAGDPKPALDSIRTHSETGTVPRDIKRAAASGLAPYTSASGSPSRHELVTRYEARTGYSIDRLRFVFVSAAFTLAAVWMTLHARDGGGDTGRLPWIDYLQLTAELAIDSRLKLRPSRTH